MLNNINYKYEGKLRMIFFKQNILTRPDKDKSLYYDYNKLRKKDEKKG